MVRSFGLRRDGRAVEQTRRNASRVTRRGRRYIVLSRFFPPNFGGSVVGSSGGDVFSQYRSAVVVLLVSRGRAGRRGIHRAANLQRQGRTQRIAFGSLVQHRTLRPTPLAVDSDCLGGDRSISASSASGDRLHAASQPSCAAGPPWDR